MSDVSTPLVSVILPTFNRAAALPRALRSVLEQSYRKLELIVVDDASTDDTEATIGAFTDERLRLVRRRTRGGAGAARNTGVAAARGELIAFQDSDDQWLPDKLSRQVAQLLEAGQTFGVNVCGYREYSDDRALDFPPGSREPLESLLAGYNFITPTWLVRRSALERAGAFDESLPSCEDYDLAFRLLDVCRFLLVNETLVWKFNSAESVYNDAARRAEGRRRVLEKNRHRWRLWQGPLATQERLVGGFLLSSGQRLRGLWYLGKALLRDPAGQAGFALGWLRRRINQVRPLS